MQAVRNASTMAKEKLPSIAVIGAGMAGLRCSDILARSGVTVTLFEARDRIGGRVHQKQSGGYLMDMGANWIHGTLKNPIMQLAERTGTVVVSPPEEVQALFDKQGVRRTDDEAVALASEIWEMIVDAFKYSDDHSAQIDPQTSLFDYFKTKLDEKKGLDRRKRDDLLHEGQMWGPFVGDPVERQSLKFFFLEECIEGENVFVASTYKDILKEVSRTALDKDKVNLRLSTPVVHFDMDPSTETQGRKKVTLTTSSGEKSSYDEVIITCPLGWLKHNHANAFTPALPPRLSQAISNIGYGRLEKLYVTFPSAFWLSRTGGGLDIGDTSSYPIFTHFHDPLYMPHPKDEAWNQSVVSLAHLPAQCAHPTLLFYIYGPCGTHLVNSIKSFQPHSEEYNHTLNAFAQVFYSRFPNYSTSDANCTPTSFLMTTWQADPFAGSGSYCNFQLGLDHADEDIECMRNAGGLTEHGLWLAGEHTAPFIALGTTTGAWWSGEGVAKRICRKYGIRLVGDVADMGDEATRLDGEVACKKEIDAEYKDGANVSALAI
jgi:hypothetical protein